MVRRNHFRRVYIARQSSKSQYHHFDKLEQEYKAMRAAEDSEKSEIHRIAPNFWDELQKVQRMRYKRIRMRLRAA